jgi:hypothetical protein
MWGVNSVILRGMAVLEFCWNVINNRKNKKNLYIKSLSSLDGVQYFLFWYILVNGTISTAVINNLLKLMMQIDVSKMGTTSSQSNHRFQNTPVNDENILKCVYEHFFHLKSYSTHVVINEQPCFPDIQCKTSYISQLINTMFIYPCHSARLLVKTEISHRNVPHKLPDHKILYIYTWYKDHDIIIHIYMV